VSDKWFSEDDIDRILRESKAEEVNDPQEESSVSEKPSAPPIEVSKISLEEFTAPTHSYAGEPDFSTLSDVPIEIRVILASVDMNIEDILELEVDSIVKLQKLAGEPVEIMVGDFVIAKGEAVIIDDHFGVLITDIIAPKERVRTVEKKLRR
jgi:flagellar motor switch protein FliN/FliY